MANVGNLFHIECIGDSGGKISILNPDAKQYYIYTSSVLYPTRHENINNTGIRLTDGSTLLYEKDFEKHSFNQTNTQKTP
jgi:hypothetical protein